MVSSEIPMNAGENRKPTPAGVAQWLSEDCEPGRDFRVFPKHRGGGGTWRRYREEQGGEGDERVDTRLWNPFPFDIEQWPKQEQSFSSPRGRPTREDL